MRPLTMERGRSVDTRRRRRGAALVAVFLMVTSLVSLGAHNVEPAAAGADVTSLFNFGLDSSQGKGQVSSLTVDEHGVLYGTTYGGGDHGYGTVFSLTPPAAGSTEWTHTILHSFCASAGCSDGSYPLSGLTFATQPNGLVGLFGTTYEGGGYGYGTIYRLLPPTSPGSGWSYTVLHSFEANEEGRQDGAYPMGRLVADTSGPLALYGTTYEGGTGYGTVYRLTPPDAESPTAWTETVLHRFGSGDDGTYPQSGPVVFEGGLYGTAYEGGAHGYGAIYQLAPPNDGGTVWSETVIYDFVGATDGANPIAGLLLGDGGTLYGTTAYGGGGGCWNDDQCGTVFQLDPPPAGQTTWGMHHLWSFGDGQTGDPIPPSYPVGDLVWGPDGMLYGTTEFGGYFSDGSHSFGACSFLYDCGTIFRFGNGMEVVHRFCDPAGCYAGAQPTAGLTSFDGKLYGTTSWQGEGEACGCGGVFRLDLTTDEAQRPDPSVVPDDDLVPDDGLVPLTGSGVAPDPAVQATAAVPVTAVSPRFTG